MSNYISPNAEPGTGTQYHIEASPPCTCLGNASADECGDINHKHPNSYTVAGVKWNVGREYFDVERKCIVELTEVMRKSPWCSTKSPEEGNLFLVFSSERDGTVRIDPHSYMANDRPITERFIETYMPTPGLGAPNPPW